MNQRHESSLLFSLAELRAIEDTRVAEELEAERLASAAEEAARNDELARERRERQDAARLAEQAREQEAAAREAVERRERFALDEAERLARVAADERIARERLRLEGDVVVSRRAPRWPLALVALALASAVGLGFAYRGAASELDETREALRAATDATAELEAKSGVLADERDAATAEIARLKDQHAATMVLAVSDEPARPARPSAKHSPRPSAPSSALPTRPATPSAAEPTAISLPPFNDDPLAGLKLTPP